MPTIHPNFVPHVPVRQARGGVDMTVVDTPEKAVLLPVLGASSHQILTQAVALLTTGGPDSVESLNLVDDATHFVLHYKPDGTNGRVTGSGVIGQVDFQETWSLNQSGDIVIDGTIGKSAEHLAITEGDDGTHLDGTIGTVDVHEVLVDNGGGDKNSAGIVWDGTVGSEAYHQELTLGAANGQEQPLSVRGNLGAAPIALDGTVYTTSDGYAIAGRGNLAGANVTIQQNLKVVSQAEAAQPPDLIGTAASRLSLPSGHH